MTALAAGALAAVTSAVIGSHLGTAGTLTGAALGSVIGAFSTALYTFGLQRTWQAFAHDPAPGEAGRRRPAHGAGGVRPVALGAITGLEKATGTSLAGEPGHDRRAGNAGRHRRVSAPSSDAERWPSRPADTRGV